MIGGSSCFAWLAFLGFRQRDDAMAQISCADYGEGHGRAAFA
jgi:hypothetical protein